MRWLDKIRFGTSAFDYFLRFCMVGGVSTFTTYAVYYGLVSVHVHVSFSYSVAYVVAFIVNYLLTTSFTFRVGTNRKNGIGFVISNIINYFFSLFLLNGFVWMGMSEVWALLPTLLISVPVNYVMVKFVMTMNRRSKK